MSKTVDLPFSPDDLMRKHAAELAAPAVALVRQIMEKHDKALLEVVKETVENYERELTASQSENATLRERVKALEAALRRLLASSEREAIACAAAEVAAANYSDANPEITAYENACIESSEAAKQARAALTKE